jgi:hypothetical protein
MAPRLKSDAKSEAFLKELMTDARLSVQPAPTGSTDVRYKGLKCIGKLPMYKELAAAVAERNACERLFEKTESQLKALDAKVQAKLLAIMDARTKKHKKRI